MLKFKDFEKSMRKFKSENIFVKFEINKLNEKEFIKKISKELVKPILAKDINEAWNKLLLDFPEKNIEIVENLKNKYRLFLLSNTNIIHYKSYIKNFEEKFSYDFNNLFEKSYYSHKAELRKPNKLFFLKVIKENNLNINETLFIDDLMENRKAAEQLGIKTIEIKRNAGLESILVLL